MLGSRLQLAQTLALVLRCLGVPLRLIFLLSWKTRALAESTPASIQTYWLEVCMREEEEDGSKCWQWFPICLSSYTLKPASNFKIDAYSEQTRAMFLLGVSDFSYVTEVDLA